MINDGSGNFLANWQLLPDFLYQEEPQVRAFQPNNYLWEDMDGDGKMDLVTAPVGYNGEVPASWNGGIYWNDGSGDFSEATLMPFVPTPGFRPATTIVMIQMGFLKARAEWLQWILTTMATRTCS